jgi:hypothetical protein
MHNVKMHQTFRRLLKYTHLSKAVLNTSLSTIFMYCRRMNVVYC